MTGAGPIKRKWLWENDGAGADEKTRRGAVKEARLGTGPKCRAAALLAGLVRHAIVEGTR